MDLHLVQVLVLELVQLQEQELQLEFHHLPKVSLISSLQFS
jgi:hypothetical protein